MTKKQAAPTKPVERFQFIPMAKIVESHINPRKTFDQARLNELAESIRVHGVLTPLIARPIPGNGHFELAAGHRRFRAAKIAGIKQLPVVVRAMTDQVYAEVLTIENLQREDLHPLEEAGGYAELVQKYGYTVELLAERVGRPVEYVIKRLKFVDLTESVKAAFNKGDILIGHAVLLARLQAEDQESALKVILGPYNRGRYTVSQLDEWIREEVYLDLKAAAWPKNTEVGGVIPCDQCTKHTGANRSLFDDVPVKQDLCLDRECYSGKAQAHLIQIITANPDLPRISSRRYISTSEAGRIGVLETETFRHIENGEKCEHAEKALTTDGPTGVGKIVKICRNPKCHTHGKWMSQPSKPAAGTADASKAYWDNREKCLADRIRTQSKRELWLRLANAPITIGRAELDEIAKALINAAGNDGRQGICPTLHVQPVKSGYSTDYEAPIIEYLAKLSDDRMPGFVIALTCARDLAQYSSGTHTKQLAAQYGIDPETVQAEVAAPLKLAFAEKRSKAEANKTKSKKEKN